MELGLEASPVSFFRSRSEETKGSTLVDFPATSKPVLGAERRRWYVHLALLTSLAGSLVSLIYLSHSITIHVIFGVLFMVMLIFHLYQRRRTVKALLKRLAGVEVRSKPSVRLALGHNLGTVSCQRSRVWNRRRPAPPSNANNLRGIDWLSARSRPVAQTRGYSSRALRDRARHTKAKAIAPIAHPIDELCSLQRALGTEAP